MGHRRTDSATTMDLGGLDWFLAGSTVALGLVLIVAPLALTPRLASLYALHGALEERTTLSRLMMSSWLPPLLAAGPAVGAVACTVTRMRPGRRRALLVGLFLVALVAAILFTRGLVAPILSAAGGG